MDAYIYQAAMLCEGCADKVKQEADANPDLDNLDKETSDYYPQGPYADGGGESDCPEHCDHCREFLENPLTQAGYEYVKEQLETYMEAKVSIDVRSTWGKFYGFERQADGSYTSDEMTPR